MAPKNKKESSKVKFRSDEQATSDLSTSAAMVDAMRAQIQRAESLNKSVKPQTIKRDTQKRYDKSKVAYSSREYFQTYDGIESKGWKRLSDSELREISQVDPYISAIISTRCSQAAVVARPSESKFDKGTRVTEVSPLDPDDYDSTDDYKKAQDGRHNQMAAILKWFETCGTDNRTVINGAFAGADPTFKYCSLPEYVTAQVRNLLTFGRAGAQIFRNEENVPSFFRPVPIETIYHGAPGQDVHIGHREETSEQSLIDASEFNAIVDETERPQHYVQRVDGQNVNIFTEDDLKVMYFQKQALFDLNGYPLSPIEQAIYMVFIHQQTLGYLRNQFLKGMATKGILVIESTDPAAQLSDEDVEQIRRDFHNFVTRTDNSAATPVLSGPIKVNFVTLSPNPNDMGFLEIEQHVIRSLCSAFQISPGEMGYGQLGDTGGLHQANKQDELAAGEERGLRMLLDIVYDNLNEILFENFPEAKELFRLSYVGVGEDTRDAVIGRQQQELQTTATLSSLWADSEKTEPVPFAGNVPLAPSFHQLVIAKMFYGEYREHFLGDDGASKKPEYQFIIDANMNQAYQQLRANPIEAQQEQTKLQLEQMEMQAQQGQQQMELAAQQGQQPQAQPGQPPQGQPAPQGQPDQQPAEAAKSLRDEFQERKKLQKSVGVYFREWIGSNN